MRPTFLPWARSSLMAALAVPAEERESFLQEHPVEDMTVRQLEQVIREREAELEKANAQTARAEEQLEELSADLREQADIIDRKDEVLACLEGLGFKILKVHTKNNWVCIEATI